MPFTYGMYRKVWGWLGTAGVIVTLGAALGAPAASAAGHVHRRVKPHAVHARFQIDLRRTFSFSGRAMTVPRRPVMVSVLVRPFVPHQRLVVRLLQGHKVLASKRPWLRASHGGGFGWLKVPVSTAATGQMRVEVLHRSSSKMHRFSHYKRLQVVSPQASFGARGKQVRLIQRLLGRLHIYIPITGVFDLHTALALDAYHRLLGWGPHSTFDGRTLLALLRGSGRFHVRYPGHGRHVEANLSRQVLALINGKRVVAIFPVSSGKPSTPTVRGNFHIYERIPGYLPDGMYYTDVFYGNYAIHGYNPAPDYPASHGCIRLPISDAIWVYNWLAMGDWVDVYD